MMGVLNQTAFKILPLILIKGMTDNFVSDPKKSPKGGMKCTIIKFVGNLRIEWSHRFSVITTLLF